MSKSNQTTARGARLLMAAALSVLWAAPALPAPDELDAQALTKKITQLDVELFTAYNACDLDKFAEFFTADVEFYHDTGGVTYSREAVVENTKKNICGKVRRELVPSTLEVYPIKDFGAIELGEHRFCEIASGKCEGVARFVMVWRHKSGRWRLTRVLSFGHHAVSP